MITNPFGLWLLALVPVIVLAHLLLQRRRVEPVSSLIVWRRLAPARRTRFWLRRALNRHLILQVLALFFAAIALAQPTIPAATSTGTQEQIIIVDASASMDAVDAEGNRMERARSRTRRLLRDAPANARVTLIRMGAQPRIVAQSGPDDPRMVDAVESLSPGDEGTGVEAALRLANTVAGGRSTAEIHMVSDTAFDDAGGVYDPKRHRVHQVGVAAPNVGISAFRIRRTPDDSAFQLFARVENRSERRFQGTLRLSIDGSLAAEEELLASAGAGASLSLTLRDVETATLRLEIDEAALDGNDALSRDNRAFAVLSPEADIRVALISEGNHFLESALAVHPRVQLTRYPRYAPSSIAADVIVLDRQENVPIVEGRVLAIRGTVAGVATRPAGFIENIGDMAWSDTHPVTRGMDMTGAFLRAAQPYLIGEGVTPILERGPHVLGYAAEGSAVRIVGFGFDLERSNIPLNPGFPILMRRSLDWLFPEARSSLPTPSSEAGTGRHIAAGTTIALQTVPGREIEVRQPMGEVFRIQSDTLTTPFNQTEQAGVYTVRDGERERRFAANLTNVGETDLRPRFQTESTAREPAAESSGSGRELRRIALLIAALLVLLDSLLWSSRKGDRRGIRT